MKKTTPAKPDHNARITVLATQDLACVLGGHNGTIIIERVAIRPRGIQGSG